MDFFSIKQSNFVPFSLTGDIEWITDIPSNVQLKLQEYIFPEHLDYIELVYDSGSSNATVRTTMALDVEALEVLFLLHVKPREKVFLTSEKEIELGSCILIVHSLTIQVGISKK